MFNRRVVSATLSAAMLLAFSAQNAAALDRWVKIVNNTSFTIVEFYGSHRDAKTWQEDILGQDVLGPGRSVNVNFDDGTGYCKFDFKAVFNDGDVLVKKNVNICEIGTFTYN